MDRNSNIGDPIGKVFEALLDLPKFIAIIALIFFALGGGVFALAWFLIRWWLN